MHCLRSKSDVTRWGDLIALLELKRSSHVLGSSTGATAQLGFSCSYLNCEHKPQTCACELICLWVTPVTQMVYMQEIRTVVSTQNDNHAHLLRRYCSSLKMNCY